MKKILAVALMFVLGIAGSALAEVYQKDTIITLDKEKPAGGTGVLYGKYSFTRDKALAENAIKEVAVLTLPPGDVVGYHKHEVNEETYIIVSGKGIFTETDGKEYEVGPGDFTVTRMGQSHAIANKGTEPLVFIAVVAAQK